jgi:hypothetical protein
VLRNKEFDGTLTPRKAHDAVADGKMDILNMWQEGDGEQDVRFFHNVEIVLRELLADGRLEGCQHLRVQGIQQRS